MLLVIGFFVGAIWFFALEWLRRRPDLPADLRPILKFVAPLGFCVAMLSGYVLDLRNPPPRPKGPPRLPPVYPDEPAALRRPDTNAPVGP